MSAIKPAQNNISTKPIPFSSSIRVSPMLVPPKLLMILTRDPFAYESLSFTRNQDGDEVVMRLLL